jgi:ADP-ribose pyrophosphatase YjhB (NUDIX family)
MPVVCVDVLPIREHAGRAQLGLIRRRSTDGPAMRWALVGGRVHRSETLSRALKRHLHETLGTEVRWPAVDASRPATVAEYFPHPVPDGLRDARQHAIALTYVIRVDGPVRAGGEAVDFAWFEPATAPAADEMVPGHDAVLARLVAGMGPDR